MEVKGTLTGNCLQLTNDIKCENITKFNAKLKVAEQIFNLMDLNSIDFLDKDIFNNIKSKILEEEKIKTESNNILSDYKIETLTKELEDTKNRKKELEDILIHNNTITSKGIEGELFVEEYIKDKIKLNQLWSINNISKDGNHNSDLELIYKSIKCVIEVKNIKAKLSESNIRKFKEVYINSLEKEYTSGIFVSLISDYGNSSGVYDFCIQTINDKHVIYLSRVKENPEKLIFAMEILDQLNKIKTGLDNKMLIELLNKQIKNYGNLYSEVNKSLSAVKEMKTSIKDYQTEIITFIEEFGNKNIY